MQTAGERISKRLRLRSCNDASSFDSASATSCFDTRSAVCELTQTLLNFAIPMRVSKYEPVDLSTERARSARSRAARAAGDSAARVAYVVATSSSASSSKRSKNQSATITTCLLARGCGRMSRRLGGFRCLDSSERHRTIDQSSLGVRNLSARCRGRLRGRLGKLLRTHRRRRRRCNATNALQTPTNEQRDITNRAETRR